MSTLESFSNQINTGYSCKGDYITLGSAMLNGEAVPNAHINIALKTLNRHGLIAGATGTGKTKTIQVLSEQLSQNGIPVLMMDIKGDFSGIAAPGEVQDFITERHAKISLPYETKSFPVELMTISKQNGVRLRATVSEFGPVLFSRILDLNDTQSGIVAIIFKYSDDHKLPLLDLKDFKKILQYSVEEGKAEFEAEYGRISTASTGSILRKIIELEQQDADLFFGETSFDVQDLMRIDENGNGYVNIIRLTDIQDKPKLFSTFMLSLLAEIYNIMPEQGDSGRPELIIFIDEAHLIFDQASKTLMNQIETIVKLIRSKGIGIYFITQNPTDIPSGVLAQLGLKIQHALRAFTANDRKAIKMTAENYPLSDFYKTNEIITQLGIGEALVTALNEKGIPTPLAATLLRSPMSRMDVLSQSEIDTLIAKSKLSKKYNEVIDRDSAYEMLTKKIESIQKETTLTETKKNSSNGTRKKTEPSTAETIGKSVTKVVTSATFIRGVFGVLTKLFKK
jgi:DNA helicase HerA-like ATPase